MNYSFLLLHKKELSLYKEFYQLLDNIFRSLKTTIDFKVASNSNQVTAKILICHPELSWEGQPLLRCFWRQTSYFPGWVGSDEMNALPRTCVTLVLVGTEISR